MKTRFVAKPLGKKWGVYDTVLGSWPGERPGIGRVKENLSEQEAQQEADRLNQHLLDNCKPKA